MVDKSNDEESKELAISEEFSLDNLEEQEGIASLINSQLDHHQQLKTILDSLVNSSSKGGANRQQLGYIVKLSEQLTSNTNSLGGLIKSRSTMKKETVDQNLKVKKAAVEEDQGNERLELSSEIINLIHNTLNIKDINKDIRNDESIPYTVENDETDIDKQIEKNLNHEEDNPDTSHEEDNTIIIADIEGYLYTYNTETEEIESLVDDDYLPVKAEEIIYNDEKEEYFAIYNEETYEVYEIE